MKYLVSFLFLIGTYRVSYAQLNVNYISASQFVQKLIGPGVSFNNAVFSGSDTTQVASFSGTTVPNIGIPSGVLLATGDAMVAADTTNNFTAGNAIGGGGDPDLSGGSNQQTKDLAAIEFDFWTPFDTVEFSFIFASEEYNYWVNSKNDICGARLYNAGGGYANVIHLPGTFLPVCVNNINNGSVPNIGDPSTGPCTNCQYFIDNTYGTTFQYNGYTSLFTIKLAVTPCDTFHFWIGIADAQDFVYDSAILLPDGGFHAAEAPTIAAVGYPAGTDTISICPGNQVTLLASISGSYTWSTGDTTQSITVTSPGTYYLSLACGAKSNEIVVQGLANSVVTIDTSFCENSSLTVNVTVPNGNYLWQDGSSSATYVFSQPGNYWVLITDSNCSYSDTFHISTIQLPTLNLNDDTTLCNSQPLTLLVDTGYAAYLWSTGSTTNTITITTTGTYLVTVSEKGCLTLDSIQVTDINCPPEIIIACTDTNFCEKKCIDFFDFSTNNPTSWQWFFPGADTTTSNLQNPVNICYNSYGSFDVTLVACNAFGCDTLILPAFINEYQPPSITISYSNDTLYSPFGFSYQWYSVDSGLITGETSYYYVSTQPGNYYVIITDTVGCEATSNIISLTSISNIKDSPGFYIAPNPHTGKFTIISNVDINDDYTIRIFNKLGQITSVFITLQTKNKINVMMNDAPPGMYFIEVIAGRKVCRSRMIKI